ncbi:MAG: PQQ-like beta-propeller repeat protein, partial [Chloroflexota bacterium]|nr:PQQ-like beta-propeller repeat protein [Chloroflexota bacterium]
DTPWRLWDGLMGCATTSGYYVWDASTGEERWRYMCRHSSWVTADEAVYVLDHGRTVFALARESGDVLWRAGIDYSRIPFGRISGFDVNAGAILVSYGSLSLEDHDWADAPPGEIYVLDASTGDALWNTKVNSHRYTFPSPRFADQSIYIWITPSRLSALDIRTGEIRWWVDAQGEHSWFSLSEDTVFLHDGTNTLVNIEAASGRVRWRFSAPNAHPHVVMAADEVIYINTDLALHALNALDGTELWRLGYECQSFGKGGISVVKGDASDIIYVSSQPDWKGHKHDDESGCDVGTLYAIDTKTGHLKWRISGVYDELSIQIWGSSVYIATRDRSVALQDNTRTNPLISKHPPHYLLLGNIRGPKQRSDVFFRLS